MCAPGLHVAMCVGVVTFDTYVVDQVMHEKVWLAFVMVRVHIRLLCAAFLACTSK